MTTNPSTGLPEELEQLNRYRTMALYETKPSNFAKAVDDHTRDVLDWACKKVCNGCEKGVPVEWFAGHHYVCNYGEVDDEFLHHHEYGGYSVCVASVLREGE